MEPRVMRVERGVMTRGEKRADTVKHDWIDSKKVGHSWGDWAASCVAVKCVTNLSVK